MRSYYEVVSAVCLLLAPTGNAFLGKPASNSLTNLTTFSLEFKSGYTVDKHNFNYFSQFVIITATNLSFHVKTTQKVRTNRLSIMRQSERQKFT